MVFLTTFGSLKSGTPDKIVESGFPPKKEILPENLKDYGTMKDKLSIFKGFTLLNHKRIIIPLASPARIIQELHSAHQGIVRMKRRARNTVYWPRIDEEIERPVQSCKACQKRLPSIPKEEMITREEPNRPFQIVAADFFSYGSKEYLAYVDRFSGWTSLVCFNKIGVTSHEMIHYVREFFTDFGIPEIFE